MDRVIEFSLNNPILIAALLIVLIAIVANEILAWRRGKHAIDTTDATQLYNRDKAVFVDIRGENAFQTSHLPGAVNIPMTHLQKRQDKLKRFKGRSIIVYCDNGQTTLKAVKALRELGWPEVYQLKGGLDAWRDASMPTEGRG